jgi:hypothetical protein
VLRLSVDPISLDTIGGAMVPDLLNAEKGVHDENESSGSTAFVAFIALGWLGVVILIPVAHETTDRGRFRTVNLTNTPRELMAAMIIACRMNRMSEFNYIILRCARAA